jgi:hypothetical protein
LVKEFCQQYQGERLSQIHKSFVNTDRIALILRKQRMLNYPNGEQVAGVRHKFVLENGSPKQVNVLSIYYQYITNILFSISNSYIMIQRTL